MCFNLFSKKKKASFVDSITPFPDEKPFISSASSADLEASALRDVARDYDASRSNVKGERSEGNVNDFLDDFDYDFLLSEFGGRIEDCAREIKNPTESDLKNALDNLTLYEGDFFTLFASDSINGCTSIGAMTKYDEPLLTVDVSVEAGTNGDKEIEKMYEKSVTAEETLKLVTDFLSGHTPDVNDGTWKFVGEKEY